MRMALCMVGQPRTLDFCFPSVKQIILDPYRPDVFISTTDQFDHMVEQFHPVSIAIHDDQETRQILGDKPDRYKLKPPEARPANDLAVTWRIQEAIGLKKQAEINQGMKYDLVMFGRFDIKIRFLQKLRPAENKTLYIPQTDAYLKRADQNGQHWGGYATQFFWCSSETADLLGKLYDLTDEYYQEQQYWHSEHLVKWWCERMGIKTELVQIHMLIIRGTSDRPVSVHNKPVTFYPGY